MLFKKTEVYPTFRSARGGSPQGATHTNLNSSETLNRVSNHPRNWGVNLPTTANGHSYFIQDLLIFIFTVRHPLISYSHPTKIPLNTFLITNSILNEIMQLICDSDVHFCITLLLTALLFIMILGQISFIYT